MQKINIQLSDNELLVLSELIYRINKNKILDNFYEDQAEQVIMWTLWGLLEKETSNIFSWNYLDDVKKARDNIRHKE
jgi:hypothetical protein